MSTLMQRLNVANEQTWQQIGNLGEIMGDTEKAIFSYENVLRHNPMNAKALISIASLYRSREQYPKAIEYYQRVVNSNSSMSDVWGALGHCYLMMDDLQKAYHAYHQALFHQKNSKTQDPHLWYGIGILYERYGSFENAEEAFLSVLKMDLSSNVAPSNVNGPFEKTTEIYFRLGIIYKQQGNYDKALGFFKSISNTPPRPLSEGDIWFQIGHVHELKKEFIQAKEAYERVIMFSPNHAKVHQQLGWLYHQNPNFADQDKAISFLSKSAEADGNDGQTFYLLGRCYMAQQKYRKAYEAYQQAVLRDGRNPTFWCSIGVLYYQINQYRDALDAYSRAIRLNPHLSEVWYDLGTLYESCSQIPDALDAYQRAAELDTSNKYIHQRLITLKNAISAGTLPPASNGPLLHPTYQDGNKQPGYDGKNGSSNSIDDEQLMSLQPLHNTGNTSSHSFEGVSRATATNRGAPNININNNNNVPMNSTMNLNPVYNQPISVNNGRGGNISLNPIHPNSNLGIPNNIHNSSNVMSQNSIGNNPNIASVNKQYIGVPDHQHQYQHSFNYGQQNPKMNTSNNIAGNQYALLGHNTNNVNSLMNNAPKAGMTNSSRSSPFPPSNMNRSTNNLPPIQGGQGNGPLLSSNYSNFLHHPSHSTNTPDVDRNPFVSQQQQQQQQQQQHMRNNIIQDQSQQMAQNQNRLISKQMNTFTSNAQHAFGDSNITSSTDPRSNMGSSHFNKIHDREDIIESPAKRQRTLSGAQPLHTNVNNGERERERERERDHISHSGPRGHHNILHSSSNSQQHMHNNTIPSTPTGNNKLQHSNTQNMVSEGPSTPHSTHKSYPPTNQNQSHRKSPNTPRDPGSFQPFAQHHQHQHQHQQQLAFPLPHINKSANNGSGVNDYKPPTISLNDNDSRTSVDVDNNSRNSVSSNNDDDKNGEMVIEDDDDDDSSLKNSKKSSQSTQNRTQSLNTSNDNNSASNSNSNNSNNNTDHSENSKF